MHTQWASFPEQLVLSLLVKREYVTGLGSPMLSEKEGLLRASVLNPSLQVEVVTVVMVVVAIVIITSISL